MESNKITAEEYLSLPYTVNVPIGRLIRKKRASKASAKSAKSKEIIDDFSDEDEEIMSDDAEQEEEDVSSISSLSDTEEPLGSLNKDSVSNEATSNPFMKDSTETNDVMDEDDDGTLQSTLNDLEARATPIGNTETGVKEKVVDMDETPKASQPNEDDIKAALAAYRQRRQMRQQSTATPPPALTNDSIAEPTPEPTPEPTTLSKTPVTETKRAKRMAYIDSDEESDVDELMDQTKSSLVSKHSRKQRLIESDDDDDENEYVTVRSNKENRATESANVMGKRDVESDQTSAAKKQKIADI